MTNHHPCICGCATLTIEKVFDDPDNDLISLMVYKQYTLQLSWRDKLRHIWAILRNQNIDIYDLIYPTPEARSLANEILSIANECEQ
jgi:hypothetical protein